MKFHTAFNLAVTAFDALGHFLQRQRADQAEAHLERAERERDYYKLEAEQLDECHRKLHAEADRLREQLEAAEGEVQRLHQENTALERRLQEREPLPS